MVASAKKIFTNYIYNMKCYGRPSNPIFLCPRARFVVQLYWAEASVKGAIKGELSSPYALLKV